jgi:putative phosphoribosyl transferase
MFTARVQIGNLEVEGDFFVPERSRMIIIFVHGSGSNKFSLRNRFVSKSLNDHGFATLLVDLLSNREKEEDLIAKNFRFDIDLLTLRLISITKWVLRYPLTEHMQVGYFSSSTGSAAALNASIKFDELKAIVSRGGRVDLTSSSILKLIKTPSLFIIGGNDYGIIDITKKVTSEFPKQTVKKTYIVPGANHFFEEKGKMQEVSRITVQWFESCSLDLMPKLKSIFHTKVSTIRSMDFRSPFQIKIANRISAGNVLSKMLLQYKNRRDVVVIGILRGGIIIADVIARNLELDHAEPVICKRLKSPFDTEDTIGGLFQDNSIYLIPESNNINPDYLKMEITNRTEESEKLLDLFGIREKKYNLRHMTVIVVDDGCFTGSTLLITCKWIKSQLPNRVIIAVPVISKQAFLLLENYVDKIEYICKPHNFTTTGGYYKDFSPVQIDDIFKILNI